MGRKEPSAANLLSDHDRSASNERHFGEPIILATDIMGMP
jgi:hypothetical protein